MTEKERKNAEMRSIMKAVAPKEEAKKPAKKKDAEKK